MANGMDGYCTQFPLGKWVYFILCRTDGSCNYGSTVGYYVLLVVS